MLHKWGLKMECKFCGRRGLWTFKGSASSNKMDTQNIKAIDYDTALRTAVRELPKISLFDLSSVFALIYEQDKQDTLNDLITAKKGIKYPTIGETIGEMGKTL